MKINRLIVLLILGIAAAFAVFIWPGAQSVGTALGNSGVPVTCYHSGTV